MLCLLLDEFTIDNCTVDPDRCNGALEPSETTRQVVAITAVNRRVVGFDVDLSTKAVKLNLVQPVVAGRRLLCERRHHRRDERNFTQHGADVGSVGTPTMRHQKWSKRMAMSGVCI